MENKKGVIYHSGTSSARVIKVIETKTRIGSGAPGDLSRIVTQYWDFKGNLLAENDPRITEETR